MEQESERCRMKITSCGAKMDGEEEKHGSDIHG